jgi:hypothetical protein
LIKEIKDYFKLDYKQAYIILSLFTAYLNSAEKNINLKFLIKTLKENDNLFERFKNSKLNLANASKILVNTFQLIEK